jgi:hypothetical protein
MSAPRGQGRRRRRGAVERERGAVLLVIMLLILGLLGLGITGLWLTSGNLQVQANTNLRAQALVVAEAGVERVRAALNAGVDVNAMLVGRTAGQDDVPTGVDAAGKPNGAGAIFVDGATTLSNVAFPPASFGRTAGTPTAPIASTQDSNGTVVIRSRGVAPDNRTAVVVEVALGATPAVPGTPGVSPGAPTVLCVSGKNACDDNSSTVSGVVAN